MIIIPAQIRNIRTMSDGGYGFTVHTNEIPEEQAMKLIRLKEKFGWFGFKENDSKLDMPKGNATFEGKTPSQRLYGKMFKYFITKYGEGDKHKFNDWYAKQINMIIDQYDFKIRDLI